METSQKPKFGRRSGSGTLIRKVEQDHRCLMGLQRNLKSYACEPRTPALFEKREELSRALESMKQNNARLLADLRDQNPNDMSPEERCRIHHRMYQDLENKVVAYMGEARQFC